MTISLPEKALSLRQPWAWAVVYGGKTIENRVWNDHSKECKFRGPFMVHAAGDMTKREYNEAHDFMETLGIKCPRPDDLVRGGIIGVSNVVDVVTKSDSPWFFEGQKGIVLSDSKQCNFIRVTGMLGFFKWKDNLNPVTMKAGPLPPLKWMKEWLR